MIFAIPLDKEIQELDISMSTCNDNICAMHISSEQSIHFTGKLPDEIYPLVYTMNTDLYHGKQYGLNVMLTKGNQNKVDHLIFGKTNARVFLISKHLLVKYLSNTYSTKELRSHYSNIAYKIEDIDVGLFINIHDRLIQNEEISDEYFNLLISKVFKNPIKEDNLLVNAHTLIQQAIFLMIEHIKEPLLIQELSKKLDVSIRTLETAFKNNLNISPKMYYKRLLLFIIEAELRHTESRSVSSVISEYQMYNLSTFGASFKNYFNKTPSEVLALKDDENPLGWNEKVFLEFSER